MKKVLGSAAGILFAVFSIAILGLLMTMTFGALGKLFPGNFVNQIWGLVLFDIAAMIWALVFVYKSESTIQYALAAIGFIAAFLGTLGMVAVEVLLGGQDFVTVEDWVGQFLVYGFVIMTALHSALLYAHHATAPDIREKIDVGIARGEIVTEAISQATKSLEEHKAALAQSIHADIVAQVKRDLGLARGGQVLDLPALPVPVKETMTMDELGEWIKQNTRPAPKPESPSLLNLLPFWKRKRTPANVYKQTAPQPVQDKATPPVNPFLNNLPPESEWGTLYPEPLRPDLEAGSNEPDPPATV